MKHTLFPCIMILVLSISGYGQRIETSDAIHDVFYRGSSEQVGSVSMAVYGNVFDGVSPSEPVFVRMKFERGAKLAHTLVDQNSDDPVLKLPLFLALYLSSIDENLQLQAPGDTVSIVRWVKGEDSLWLRVQQDSGQWVSDNGTPRAPGEQDPVMLQLGVSARNFTQVLSNLPSEKKNLPYNTRNPEQAMDDGPEEAVSNLICLDLSGSEVAPSGINSVIEYYATAYGSDAQYAPGLFEPGSPRAMDLRGNFIIGRGKDRACSIEPVSTPVKACIEDLASIEFYTVENQLDLGVTCTMGGGYIENVLVEGASLTFTVEDGSYGFGENGARFAGDSPGTVQLTDPFETEFGMLYRRLDLFWDGPQQSLADYLVQVVVQLQISTNAAPEDLLLNWSLNLVNHGDEQDEAPFSGSHQAANCGASPFVAGSGLWHVGTWGCGLASERLFPHVTRSTGGFSTGLVVANTSSEKTSYAISVYDPLGNATPSISSSLNGNETVVYDGVLFQLPEGGYLSVFGSEDISVSAVYQADGEGKGPAHVGEATTRSAAWRLYPGNEAVTWDGVALVNTGSSQAVVTAFLKNAEGETLEAVELDSPAGGEKLLVLLTGLFTQPTNGAYYEIRSSEPLALTALRGAWSGAFLWENSALAVP